MKYRVVIEDNLGEELYCLVDWTDDRLEAMTVANAQRLSGKQFIAVYTDNPKFYCVYRRHWPSNAVYVSQFERAV